jgi:HSP20 family protein
MIFAPASAGASFALQETEMKLDLSRWNPFKFVRRHSDTQSGSRQSGSRASSPQPTQHQQQSTAAAGTQQMGGGATPDPMRMMTTMLRDPFGSLAQLDRWFGDFSPAAFEPNIDVVDDGNAIRITAELPGMDRNDVQIMLEDEYLVISGEKKLERRDEEEGAYRVERAFGSFQRIVPLPDGVDVERAEAKFDNGTLTIRLPKVAAAQQEGRRLEISQSPSSSSSSASPQAGAKTGARPQQG